MEFLELDYELSLSKCIVLYSIEINDNIQIWNNIIVGK